MTYTALLMFHYVAVLLFGGFILLDRLFFRRYLASKAEDTSRFYRLSRSVLVPAVSVIVLTGIIMTGIENERLGNPLFILKLLLALVVIGMFFYCPVFSGRYGEGARRLYRAFVVLLLLTVVVLSKLFI